MADYHNPFPDAEQVADDVAQREYATLLQNCMESPGYKDLRDRINGAIRGWSGGNFRESFVIYANSTAVFVRLVMRQLRDAGWKCTVEDSRIADQNPQPITLTVEYASKNPDLVNQAV